MKMSIKTCIEKYGYEIGYEKLKRNNAISKRFQTYIDKYGIVDGIIRYLNICKANAISLDKFIKKYGEEEGTKRYNNWKNNCALSLESFIRKYGEEEGTKRYNNWKNNSRNNRLTSLDKFIKKYGEEEGTKRYKDWKKSLDNSSLESFIKKYGEEEGTKRYNDYIHNMSISVKKSMKPGIMKYINSKQFYIDKYGEEEGTKRYKDWKKSQDHSSLVFFIKKYGEEEGFKKYISVNHAKMYNAKVYYSQISQELFKILNAKLNDNANILFATKNLEFSLYNEEFNEKYFYDFCYNNKIIEYNGDFWHANPKIYNDFDIVHNNKTAKDIWEYDARKQLFAKNNGYDILIIWDSDYNYNKLDVISKCIDFLLKQ